MTITRAFALACARWTDAIARARADYQRVQNRACHNERCDRLLTDDDISLHDAECGHAVLCRRCRSEARRQASDYMKGQTA